MYTENGITYVEGIEDVFMGYFLKYQKKKYKHIQKEEVSTPEQVERIKIAEENFRLKVMAKQCPDSPLLNPEPPKEAPKPKKKKIEVTKTAEEVAKMDQKEYHRRWYAKNREAILAKLRKPNSNYGTLGIPAPAGTKEYAKLYWEIKGEAINERRRKRERKQPKQGRPKSSKNTWGTPSDYPDRKSYQEAYNAANRDKIRAKHHQYYEEHKEQMYADYKERLANDPELRERRREYSRQYHQRKKEKACAK